MAEPPPCYRCGKQPCECKRFVNVSGGMASAVCLFRVLEKFGRDSVLPVFADTRWESPDTYRFLDDVERVAGVPIERLSNGRNIWDVFMQSSLFTTLQGGCKASWELKKLPLRKFCEQYGTPEDSTVYVGLGADEERRRERTSAALLPWIVEYPLMWPPMMNRCDLADDLRQRGIEPPDAYAKGYPHNNCGGACILAGIAQWCGLLKDNPSLYAESERREQELLAELQKRERTEVTILKDRRGGEVANLSLRKLREEIEAGVREPKDTWRASTCSCMGMLF